MPKCVIDGREVEFAPGENLVEVARRAGIEIPVFCYHPGLSVVAQCRMCAVEIEKSPKLQTACSTVATDGMIVSTRSEKARQNQKAIMEFLLANHPLDCPICDKAGECDLQEHSFKYGAVTSRHEEERRTYVDLDMGPVIRKNMNRCIHCTRCIRFGDEVAGIREMVATRRGNNTEIGVIDGRPLETTYAGNYADICPTGSLTLKDFRFRKRVWTLKRTSSTCEGCSRGCAIEIDHEEGQIHRCVAGANDAVNKFWICDEGRFLFRSIHSAERIRGPVAGDTGSLAPVTWEQALAHARQTIAGGKCALLVGSDLTQEDLTLLSLFVPKAFGQAPVFHFGTPGVTKASDDAGEDRILRRKSHTANLHGVEKLSYPPFLKMPAGINRALVFRGGRAVLPELAGVAAVGIGVFKESEAKSFSAVLPMPGFGEREGTVINFEGREQLVRRAIAPPAGCRELANILRAWMGAS